jgi:hypothetical protein
MSDGPIDEFEVGGLTVKLYTDDDPSNPRTDNDNACKLACWHRRYHLGDEGQGYPSKRTGTAFPEPQDYHETKREWAKAGDPVVLELALWLYDHSGITIYVAGSGAPGTNCPWDSGQVGWAYMRRSDVLSNFMVKRLSKKVLQQAEDLMRAEVEEYDQYLRGEVYSYVVEDQDGEQLDSCSGYFGYEYAKQEAKAAGLWQLQDREAKREEDRELHDDA